MSFLPRSLGLGTSRTAALPTLPLPKRSLHFSSIRKQPPGTTAGPTARPSGSTLSHSNGHAHPHLNGSAVPKKGSPHIVWYREIVPAMVPILLLSSTIFLSLTLLRTHLSHSLSLSESGARIAELEAQLDRMRRDQRRLMEKERKERERILPLVVERVLQRVGAMSEEAEEAQEDEGVFLV